MNPLLTSPISEPMSAIASQLFPFRNLWQDEVLTHLELNQLYQRFPSAWCEKLTKLSFDELTQLEVSGQLGDYLGRFDKSFAAVTDLLQIKPACYQTKITDTPPFSGISLKKQQEMLHFKSVLTEYFPGTQKLHYLDVGTGVGHLSNFLSPLFSEITSIEKNPVLHAKHLISKSEQVYPLNTDFFEFCPMLTSPHLCGGLHACGDLSDAILHYFINNKKATGLISMRCCYYLLKKYNHFFSTPLLSYPTPTVYAWSLATRTKSPPSEREAKRYFKIKRLRYTFELYLREELGVKPPIILGASTKTQYQKWNFSDYATTHLLSMHLPCPPNTAIMEFYFDNVAERVKALICANQIRNLFGKPLEYLLYLDRAHYLQEQTGSKTWVIAYIPEKISPRQLCLIAKK